MRNEISFRPVARVSIKGVTLHCHFQPAGQGNIIQLYKSTVLPLLDYTIPVSGIPTMQTTYMNMIERVQKFVARLATKQWNTSYHYNNDLLAQLGWPLLSTWRKQQKLFLCHRILSGYSIIPPSSFIPHPSPTLQHSHHLPLYRPVTRSTAFSSVVPLWNSLSLDTVLATSHCAFKSKIKLNSNLYNIVIWL